MPTTKDVLQPRTPVPSDIDVAQSIDCVPIQQIAAELGIEDELELYGRYKAKVRERERVCVSVCA
jgi:formate--tetrahydrofolate ligase